LICGYGEPHFVTADASHVDFQAAGEFVLARSADGSLEMQGRFQPPGAKTWVTLTTALALKLGDDRVAFYNDPERQIVVNGVPVSRAEYAANLPGGGVVERHGSLATVTWPDGSRLGVQLFGFFMSFALMPSDAVRPSSATTTARRRTT
jgi:hypothetical protein